ncbi:MAG: LPXTG cell wall anchor domain-containing protein, partial [Lachnospiraceae bacterium]|nr:LPXTG cell wall anchor domain-containing protein [Lachnospiraceae bacterium]
YFNERCWEVEVGEDRQDPETYFREVNGLDTGASVEIPYTLSLNGYNTDNPYECTYWSFVTGLILKIKPLVPATYQANINYDHTYHYQVNYDVVTESYRIDIDGVGSYQVSDRVITRLPDEDNGGGGSSTTQVVEQVVEIGDVTVPLTDSIVLSDEAVPLADSVVIPDEDAPLADSVPQTGDDALSVLPGLAAGLAALVGVFGFRRKERE